MTGVGHMRRMGEKRSAYRNLAEKHVGKTLLVKPNLMWENNNKINPEEVV
jgi:hypothetical protein